MIRRGRWMWRGDESLLAWVSEEVLSVTERMGDRHALLWMSED